MTKKEKEYTLTITEKELRDSSIKKHLVAIVEKKLKLRKHDEFIVVSEVEYNFIKNHYTWRNVKDYLPTKKGRFKGEVGKYNGKRVCVEERK